MALDIEEILQRLGVAALSPGQTICWSEATPAGEGVCANLALSPDGEWLLGRVWGTAEGVAVELSADRLDDGRYRVRGPGALEDERLQTFREGIAGLPIVWSDQMSTPPKEAEGLDDDWVIVADEG